MGTVTLFITVVESMTITQFTPGTHKGTIQQSRTWFCVSVASWCYQHMHTLYALSHFQAPQIIKPVPFSQLLQTRMKTNCDRTFSVVAPTLWNKLPIFIRSSPITRHVSFVLKHIFILWLSSQFRVTHAYCNCVVCCSYLLLFCTVALKCKTHPLI